MYDHSISQSVAFNVHLDRRRCRGRLLLFVELRPPFLELLGQLDKHLRGLVLERGCVEEPQYLLLVLRDPLPQLLPVVLLVCVQDVYHVLNLVFFVHLLLLLPTSSYWLCIALILLYYLIL